MKDSQLHTHVVVKSSNLVISRCRYAEDLQNICYYRCGTCSTIIYDLLSNDIIVLWRCCCRRHRRFLSSLMSLLGPVMELDCSFRKLVGVNCGLNSRNPNESNVVPLLSCKKDISGYKMCFGINDIDSEVELILARASIFSLPSDVGDRTVCPSHRYPLGIGWGRGSHRCRVPSGLSKHVQEGKSRKAETHRGISKESSRTILRRTELFVATGSGMYD